MNKFAALYHNEMVKLTRRVLVLIGLISLLAVPLLFFAVEKNRTRFEEMAPQNAAEAAVKAEAALFGYESEAESYRSQQENVGQDSPDYAYFGDLAKLFGKIHQEAEIIYREKPEALSYAYMDELLHAYASYSIGLETYDASAEEFGEDSAEARTVLSDRGLESREQLGDLTGLARAALNSRRFEDFLAFSVADNERFSGQPGVYQPERLTELWETVEQDESWIYDSRAYNALTSLITRTLRAEEALETGIDGDSFSGAPLTAWREKEIRHYLPVYLYQIDHSAYAQAENGQVETYLMDHAARAGKLSFMACFVILLIGMMILAASSVSQEIETGTVKALIISPVKRWKILLAKLLSLLTLAFLLILMANLWIQLLGLLFFGELSQAPLLLNFGGRVAALPGLAAALLNLAAGFIHVSVYILVALTLSTVIRKTAISVGLSIALGFASIITQAVQGNSLFREYFRLLPFLHMDLGARIGTTLTAIFGDIRFGVSPYIYIPLWMSAVYLAVFGGLLLAIMLDSFGRRDL